MDVREVLPGTWATVEEGLSVATAAPITWSDESTSHATGTAKNCPNCGAPRTPAGRFIRLCEYCGVGVP